MASPNTCSLDANGGWAGLGQGGWSRDVANVQSQFNRFHDEIRLDFDDSAPLREKRDILKAKLDERLSAMSSEWGEDPPEYKTFDQGSYALGTGVRPVEGGYDIDVGVHFDVRKGDFDDPVEVKRWVFDALNGHTQRVEMRTPCVTVFYQQDGEEAYHVDLAVYASSGSFFDDRLYLARGRQGSKQENRVWEESNPRGLIKRVRDAFEGDERKQFRRVIRYLKRWKDLKFDSAGNAAPTGIAITVAGLHWFRPVVDHAWFSGQTTPDDLLALRRFVEAMISHFKRDFPWMVEQPERLKVELPTAPHSDLLADMTDPQMLAFKQKLEGLRDALTRARDATDPVEACEILQQQFGDEFPVPERSETAQRRSRAIVSSSSSG